MVAKATSAKKAAPKKTTNAPKRHLALERQTKQRTSAREWLLGSRGEEIEVPSGNVALLRRPGPEMFFQGGLVPDALSGIVNSAIREKQGLPPEKVADLGNDAKMLPKMMMMIDSAVVEACVDPKVVANPTCIRPIATIGSGTDEPGEPLICGEPAGDDIHTEGKDHHKFIPGDAIPPDERDPEFLYCAEIDFNDKVFIFQYAAGGSADLERFREEYQQLVDSVSAKSDSPK